MGVVTYSPVAWLPLPPPTVDSLCGKTRNGIPTLNGLGPQKKMLKGFILVLMPRVYVLGEELLNHGNCVTYSPDATLFKPPLTVE